VIGGVRFLHVDFVAETQIWRPHLHCIVEAARLLSSDIWEDWSRTTGAWACHDAALPGGDALKAAVKYASRCPFLTLTEHPFLVREYADVTRQRTAQVFGCWYGQIKLSVPSYPKSAIPALSTRHPCRAAVVVAGVESPQQRSLIGEAANVSTEDRVGLDQLAEGRGGRGGHGRRYPCRQA